MEQREVATRIEQVRNDLDIAINLANRECRAVLLKIDKALARLKRDMGQPNAGLVKRGAV